ncbi:MAG: hypothetical protein AVDCRST_MAG66-2069, partial [uncultured Pseudonocardia sp.]
ARPPLDRPLPPPHQRGGGGLRVLPLRRAPRPAAPPGARAAL